MSAITIPICRSAPRATGAPTGRAPPGGHIRACRRFEGGLPFRAFFGEPMRLSSFAAATIMAAAPLIHVVAQSPEPIRFARNAGISNDGRVAFTYQDDIWVVDADGS